MSSTEAYQAPPNGFRTFLIVWGTQSLSVFGSALTFFAITIWLTQTLYPRPEQKPELALALAAVSLAFAVPTILIATIAGAWADRHDRKRTMMIADFTNGCLSLILMTLMATGVLQLPELLVLLVLFATAGAFHGSAFDTSYAMIVPEKQLPRANGMMQTIWALSGILSPAIAAFIIALPALARQSDLSGPIASYLAGLQNGAPVAIAIDAVTFFIAAATLIFLYIPSPKRTDLHTADGKKKSIWADVKEGGLYIWQRRPLLWLLATFTVANFAGGPVEVFVPLILKFNLSADWLSKGFTFETALALMSTVVGIGGLAGGLFITAWGGLKKRRVVGVLVPMIVSGVAMIIFGFSSGLYLSSAMGFLFVAMTPIMNAHSQTIWQTQTPRELQGRVFSVRRVIAQCTWPLSTALAGILGGLFNPGMVIAVLGVVLVVFCVAQFFNPVLMRVEDKTYLDGLAEVAQAAGGEVASGEVATGSNAIDTTGAALPMEPLTEAAGEERSDMVRSGT